MERMISAVKAKNTCFVIRIWQHQTERDLPAYAAKVIRAVKH